MNWQDIFTVTYHPSPGVYIIHWKSMHKPALDCTFSTRAQAEIYLKYHSEEIINKEFEKIVLT